MPLRVGPSYVRTFFASCSLIGCAAVASAQDPWADHVVSHDAGSGGTPGYPDPVTTLGPPERFTGEGTPYPGVVSIFNPPWGADELFSFGHGGHLVVEFDEPITDDPQHAFGIDLIIFGNGGFVDVDYPNGRIGRPAEMFGDDPMHVSVSADGVNFVPLGEFTEGFLPAQGFLDSGPYDTSPGSLLTDFTRPLDPTLGLSDFDGLAYADALSLYAGSGGGTPIDISPTGLSAVRFVKVEVLQPDATVEIDAFAAVPEPRAGVLLGLLALACAFRRRC